MADGAGTWRRKPGLAEAELDGEVVVWDPDSGHVARLDRVGTAVWSGLDGSATLEELAGDLSAAFGVPPATVLGDVRDLVGRLRDLSLVVEVPPPAP